MISVLSSHSDKQIKLPILALLFIKPYYKNNPLLESLDFIDSLMHLTQLSFLANRLTYLAVMVGLLKPSSFIRAFFFFPRKKWQKDPKFGFLWGF